MTADMAVVRGDTLTFDLTLDITIDGTPVDDLADWEPVCPFRTGTESSSFVAPALTVAGTVCSFALTSPTTAEMTAGEWLWDVQVTNPDADPGLGTYTWPPAVDDDGNRAPRKTLLVVPDVSRPVEEP